MTSTENIFTAKTVDEAILDGLSTLGLTIDEVEITVLEEGKKKLFGRAVLLNCADKRVHKNNG